MEATKAWEMLAHHSELGMFADGHVPFLLDDWRAQQVDDAQGHQAHDHAEGNEPRLRLVAERRLQGGDDVHEVQCLVGQQEGTVEATPGLTSGGGEKSNRISTSPAEVSLSQVPERESTSTQ